MVALRGQYQTMATHDLDEDLAGLDRDALIAEDAPEPTTTRS